MANSYKIFFCIFCLFFLFMACVNNGLLNRNFFKDETGLRFPPLLGETVKIRVINAHSDLLVLTTHQLYFLLNKGNGYFEDQSFSNLGSVNNNYSDIISADINLDQNPEIILIGNNVSILENDGKGRFIDKTNSIIDNINGKCTEGVLGDLDGDKYPDLIVWGKSELTLFMNRKGFFKNETSSRLPQGINNIQRVVLGDFDNDKNLDIFVVRTNAENMILKNNGGGMFIDQSLTHLPRILANHQDAAAGDIDGDGDMDIILAVNKLDQNIRLKNSSVSEEFSYSVFPNSDFERGNFSGWSATGGWQIVPLGGDPLRQKPNPQDGIFYALSVTNLVAPNREANTGVVRSEPFLIPSTAKYLNFLKTGWDGQFGGFKNFFYLKKTGTGTILRKTSPPMADNWVLQSWNIEDLRGEHVYFEAVDQNFSGIQGSIGFDQLKFSDISVENGSLQSLQTVNYILHNDGEGYFTDEVLEELPMQPAFRVYLKDIDHNGELDIFFLGAYETNLLVNQGKGRFFNQTDGFFKGRNLGFTELNFGDFDQDGNIDLAGISKKQTLIFMNHKNPINKATPVN